MAAVTDTLQAYFVHIFQSRNLLTPNYVLVLFIVSVLAAAWAIATVFRRKSTRDSAIFVSFIDLCFVGAFIAGVYELRSIAHANCSNFSADSNFSLTINNNGVSGDSPFHFNIDKHCAMLKASFAFGIMNCIFFAVTAKATDGEVMIRDAAILAAEAGITVDLTTADANITSDRHRSTCTLTLVYLAAWRV
ncbi:MAG: hypothetical protein Q9220_006111 [cf. Caloplaca sp. 1 TL-2023]